VFAAPEAGTLVQCQVSAGGWVEDMEPVGPAGHAAVVTDVDPARSRLTVASGGRTRVLRVGGTSIYAVSHPDWPVRVGSALRLTLLAPGDRVWLDDPEVPDYILVLREDKG